MSNQDITVAMTYHEETKHSYESVYRSHHFLDWENQPRPFKLYTTLPPQPLPQPLADTQFPLLQALSPTATVPVVETMPALADLAYILFYAAGVTKRRAYPGYGEMLFRAAACTGALYHIELYLAVTDLPGLAAGLYHFAPLDFALRCLRRGDYRHVLFEASGHTAALQDAPAVIIGSDTFWRNAWKYRARAYRHSFWDSGTILANLGAAATARRLPTHLVLGFTDTLVNALLDLEPSHEAALFCVGVGQGAPPPPIPPPIAPLHLDVAPLSQQEVTYPAIGVMHQASMLASPEEASAWRVPLPPTASAPASGPVYALRPNPAEQLPTATIEAVIRRRGSTRQFADRPLSQSQLANLLLHATPDIPADFLEPPSQRLNDLYLIVNAVTDLPAGAYVFRPEESALELLQAGDFRHQAGTLALGQTLAAEASVNIYFLCDLTVVLEWFGNRGYRAAQLEAGILGGRIYLAAYAQGFGATGLTFFDDDVTEFFSPHAAGKSVMFLVACGYAAPQRA